MKEKGYITDAVFSIILIVILVMRIILSDGEFSAYIITVINLIGAQLAILSTIYEVIKVMHREDYRNIMIIVWIVLVIMSIGYSTFCIVEQINFHAKANDCITIVALLFSIPNDLYIELVRKGVNQD